MGSEWSSLTLEDIVVHQKGFPFKSKDYLSDGSPVVRVSNFTADSISTNDLKYVSSDIAKETKSVELKPYDVVIATVGSWPKNPDSIVGKVIRVPEGLAGSLLNQNAVRLRVKSDNYYDQIYLYYLLKNKTFSDYIVSTAQGSANQASITLKDVYRYETDYPSDLERESIGKILLSLDNKITLNRQLNQTLEQIAQALFKSWFVDFDPVIDNALAAGNVIPDDLQDSAERRQLQLAKADHKPLPENIRKLFPSEFELTESLGWVPKGWGVKSINEFGQVICGKTPSKDNPDFFGGDIPFIKIPDMHNEMFVVEPTEYLSDSGAKSQGKKTLPRGSICVSCIATVGKVVITTKESQTNQQINSIVPSENHLTWYLYFYMLTLEKEFHDFASGGSTTLNMNTSTFSKIQILSPDASVLKCFHGLVSGSCYKIEKSMNESVSLKSLRDTLLPKLISGELRIPEAQAQLEEALG